MNSYFINTDVYIIPDSDQQGFEISADARLVVVVKEDDYAAQEELLINILKAIGFSIGENAFVIKLQDGQQVAISELLPESVDHVLCFGVRPKEIGFNAGFRANTIYKTESYSILLAHALSKLAEDNKHKKALWTSLQQAFNKS